MHRAPETRRPIWDRIAALVCGRRSWMLALIVVYLGVEYPNVSVEKSFELP